MNGRAHTFAPVTGCWRNPLKNQKIQLWLFVSLSSMARTLVRMDVAKVFEGVAARLDRLVRPLMAFVTFYGLLVVVFACLYRIADLTTRIPQFSLHGGPARISFVDSLYFSVATITTLGFGDIAPASRCGRSLRWKWFPAY